MHLFANSKILSLTNFCLLAILFFFSLSAISLLEGTILFHTDIARDFLLVNNMIQTHKLDLIGPRAGGIPGVFFGPLYYYALIPIFFITKGNPIAVGYFWYFLIIIALLVEIFVAKKIFNQKVALLSGVLYSAYLVTLSNGFTQSFFTLIFSPIFFLVIYYFYKTKNWRYFAAGIILLGILIQLQPAFGVLMLFATIIFSVFYLYKIKKLVYLFNYLLIFLPLSTYVVFELRHDFLETKAVINFIFNNNNGNNLLATLSDRVFSFVSSTDVLQSQNLMIGALFLLFYIFLFRKYLYKNKKNAIFYKLVLGYYIFFWLLSFFFSGSINNYYYMGFIPLGFMIFLSLIQNLNKKIFVAIFLLCLLYTTYDKVNQIIYWQNNFYNKDISDWKEDDSVAKFIFKDSAGKDFGYYVFSTSEYGYSTRYSLIYEQQFNKNHAVFCKKLPLTYIVYNPDSNGSLSNPYFKTQRVVINQKPIKKVYIGNKKIGKYALTAKDLKIPSDPNLVCNLQFR